MHITNIFDGGMLIVSIAMALLLLWQAVMIIQMVKDHAIFAKRKQGLQLACALVYLGIGILDILLQKSFWFGLAFLLLGIANLMPLGGISQTVLYAGGRRMKLKDASVNLTEDKGSLVLHYESHIHYGYLSFSYQDKDSITKIIQGCDHV